MAAWTAGVHILNPQAGPIQTHIRGRLDPIEYQRPRIHLGGNDGGFRESEVFPQASKKYFQIGDRQHVWRAAAQMQ